MKVVLHFSSKISAVIPICQEAERCLSHSSNTELQKGASFLARYWKPNYHDYIMLVPNLIHYDEFDVVREQLLVALYVAGFHT